MKQSPFDRNSPWLGVIFLEVYPPPPLSNSDTGNIILTAHMQLYLEKIAYVKTNDFTVNSVCLCRFLFTAFNTKIPGRMENQIDGNLVTKILLKKL